MPCTFSWLAILYFHLASRPKQFYLVSECYQLESNYVQGFEHSFLSDLKSVTIIWAQIFCHIWHLCKKEHRLWAISSELKSVFCLYLYLYEWVEPLKKKYGKSLLVGRRGPFYTINLSSSSSLSKIWTQILDNFVTFENSAKKSTDFGQFRQNWKVCKNLSTDFGHTCCPLCMCISGVCKEPTNSEEESTVWMSGLDWDWITGWGEV